jgi:hypothetical protein
MYCKKCGGFGFYTVKKADGTTEGKKCDAEAHGVLKQDLEGTSSLTRTHGNRANRPVQERRPQNSLRLPLLGS